MREHQLRDHPRGLDRTGQPARGIERERERLFEHERLAGVRRAHRELRLHVGRHRERHRIARVEQRLERGRGDASVPRGERLRLLGAAAPHTGQAGLGPGGEHRRVHLLGPRAGAHERDGESWGGSHAGRMLPGRPRGQRAGALTIRIAKHTGVSPPNAHAQPRPPGRARTRKSGGAQCAHFHVVPPLGDPLSSAHACAPCGAGFFRSLLVGGRPWKTPRPRSRSSS